MNVIDLNIEDSVKMIHGANGYFEPIRGPWERSAKLMIDDKEAVERGFAHERIFAAFVTWLMKNGRLPWIRRIRHASQNEDQRHKIDFKIDAQHPADPSLPHETILIQIKSSWPNPDTIREISRNKRIYLIVVNEFTDTDMVCKVLEDICSRVFGIRPRVKRKK
jgi:hypothetical protein